MRVVSRPHLLLEGVLHRLRLHQLPRDLVVPPLEALTSLPRICHRFLGLLQGGCLATECRTLNLGFLLRRSCTREGLGQPQRLVVHLHIEGSCLQEAHCKSDLQGQ